MGAQKAQTVICFECIFYLRGESLHATIFGQCLKAKTSARYEETVTYRPLPHLFRRLILLLFCQFPKRRCKSL